MHNLIIGIAGVFIIVRVVDPARNSPGGNLLSHFSENGIESDNWSIFFSYYN